MDRHGLDRRGWLKTGLALSAGALLPVGVTALVGRHGLPESFELISFNGKIMGTGYSVLLANPALISGPQTNLQLQNLKSDVHAALQDIDRHMSTWRADSDISVFNLSLDQDWQRMTPAGLSVITHALKTSKDTRGAFDASVGPLIDLWGFGAGSTQANTRSAFSKPDSQLISKTLQQVGYEQIDIDLSRGAIRKQNPRLQLDFSGIAKGYAVDQVAGLLDEQGIQSYLVEVGGELRSRGLKPDGSNWKVAIERPSSVQRDVFRVIRLSNKSVATSGDYRNFFMDGSQRYSHSIDPRTGIPVRHQLASVSVVADSAMQADALSTAMMVMGPSEAVEFAEQHHIAAHLILKSGNGLEEAYSSGFASLLA